MGPSVSIREGEGMSDDASVRGLKIAVEEEINQMEDIQALLTDASVKIEALERFHTIVFGIAPTNGHTKTMARALAQMNAAMADLEPLGKAFRDEAGEYAGAL